MAKKSKSSSKVQESTVMSGGAVLFAGAICVFLGKIQADSFNLFIIGFGAALLIVGAVILAGAINMKR